jgi:hypothetical protein
VKDIRTLTDAEIDSVLNLLSKVVPRVETIHRQAKRGRLKGTDAWYMASYGVLTATRPSNREDFIRVVAFAYSWLPRSTPVAQPTEKQVRSYFELLRKATSAGPRKNKRAIRERLLRATRLAIGVTGAGASVTASKVLHFSDPSVAPMFDRWVVEALRQLNIKKPEYIEYWSFVDRLIGRAAAHPKLGVLNYRRVDELLFQMGKSARSPAKPSSIKVTPKPSVPRSGRKMQNARAIYARLRGQPSAVVRRALVVQAGLTEKGANTYYYKFRREERGAA